MTVHPLHPFRALVLNPGPTPSQVITLGQVAELLVSEAVPALARSAGNEADVILDIVHSVIAPNPGTPRCHRFSGSPGEVHARMLRLAALATALADRVAVSFDLAPGTPLPLAQRLDLGSGAVIAMRETDGGAIEFLPCDTEPA